MSASGTGLSTVRPKPREHPFSCNLVGDHASAWGLGACERKGSEG